MSTLSVVIIFAAVLPDLAMMPKAHALNQLRRLWVNAYSSLSNGVGN
ncbi:MAG TPA: hypothetical protein VIZ65_02610 [Cellvibrionaceae bacterium]